MKAGSSDVQQIVVIDHLSQYANPLTRPANTINVFASSRLANEKDSDMSAAHKVFSERKTVALEYNLGIRGVCTSFTLRSYSSTD